MQARIKLSVLTDVLGISVPGFYRYIRYIRDILYILGIYPWMFLHKCL